MIDLKTAQFKTLSDPIYIGNHKIDEIWKGNVKIYPIQVGNIILYSCGIVYCVINGSPGLCFIGGTNSTQNVFYNLSTGKWTFLPDLPKATGGADIARSTSSDSFWYASANDVYRYQNYRYTHVSDSSALPLPPFGGRVGIVKLVNDSYAIGRYSFFIAGEYCLIKFESDTWSIVGFGNLGQPFFPNGPSGDIYFAGSPPTKNTYKRLYMYHSGDSDVTRLSDMSFNVEWSRHKLIDNGSDGYIILTHGSSAVGRYRFNTNDNQFIAISDGITITLPIEWERYYSAYADDNYIYIFGGTTYKEVYRYTKANRSWQRLPDASV